MQRIASCQISRSSLVWSPCSPLTNRFRNQVKGYNSSPIGAVRFIPRLHRFSTLCPHVKPCLAGCETMMGFPMNDFARLLEEQIPRLRRYARALARDVNRADDLVQSCLVRALAKQHLWQRGTNLRAWLFTILHNQHVNDVRHSAREGTSVELTEATGLTAESNALPSLQLRDLERALAALAIEQREVILLVGLE